METKSCITDKPIRKINEDQLKMARYAKVLSGFIHQSDTPLTVGLQGEWGTGKTSMLYMLLEQFKEKKIATSWVNTWEYSMFRSSSETTPAILKGMLTNLKENCIQEGHWTLNDKTENSVKKIYSFLGNAANQFISNQTGIDLKSAIGQNEIVKEQAEIAEIKKEISNIINILIEGDSPYKKVVFLVDDLDRIPPEQAVEVLESLKNLFDVPHCVFVLAIDYDVVVKGLEAKFGKKTEENEREFRSFFDKIIQVPFNMPTGTYDMGNLLAEKLSSLGIDVPENLTEAYSSIVKNTIGYNPRSLKRYINSFSLLRNIRNADFENDKEEFQNITPTAEDDMILFAMIGIQISYPKIFRLIIQEPDVYSWDKSFSNKINVDLDKVKEEIKKYGENDKLDEDWEQIIYGACQTDVYLRSKQFNVIELINFLRNHFENRSEALDEKIVTALRFAAITNVDDDVNTKNSVEKRGRKSVFSDIHTKIQMLREELEAQGAKKEGLAIKLDSYKKLFDAFEEMSITKKWQLNMYGKYVKIGNESEIAYIFNPPKQTELVSLKLQTLSKEVALPTGLALEKVYDDGYSTFKVSKDLQKKSFMDFIGLNY